MSVGIVLNLIARRQEGVEAQDKLPVASEQLHDSINDARCINTAATWAGEQSQWQIAPALPGAHVPLSSDLLHDVEKLVVDLWLLLKLHLHLIKVGEGILHLELPVLRRGLLLLPLLLTPHPLSFVLLPVAYCLLERCGI
jgi:hypothetical protein